MGDPILLDTQSVALNVISFVFRRKYAYYLAWFGKRLLNMHILTTNRNSRESRSASKKKQKQKQKQKNKALLFKCPPPGGGLGLNTFQSIISFGTLKDRNSLLINNSASNNCLCHKNVFQIDVNSFSKMFNHFLPNRMLFHTTAEMLRAKRGYPAGFFQFLMCRSYMLLFISCVLHLSFLCVFFFFFVHQ